MPSCKHVVFMTKAGEFSYLVGLPGKSGVGSGIAAVYPLALFSRSMEPKTEPEREFRYGHQGFGTADHTDTGIYFLKNFSVDIYQSPPL